MIEFREMKLSDKDWATKLMEKSNYNSCEYSFATNFIWRNVYDLKIAYFNDFYIIRSGKKGNYKFIFSPGSGDLKSLVEELDDYCKKEGQALNFIAVNNMTKNSLDKIFPGQFEYSLERDSFDYIYKADDLINLKGKKYHSKRNYINQFMTEYGNRYKYENIDKSNISECFEMNCKWYKKNNCYSDISKKNENFALVTALENFFELPLNGGLIRIDERVVAFSIGEAITKDTYHIMFEKAFSDIKGAYPVINQMFAQNNCSDFTFINREEDVGSPGLRKSKLSYKPVELLEKWSAVLIK